MSAHKNERPSSVAPGRPGSAVFPTNPLGEKHEGIATGRDVEWEPLVDFRRMDVSENTIHGAIAWAHGGEIIHSFGGNVLVYGRSMMKPLRMKPFTDALDELDWKQKAIACSSHNGDTEHVAAAQSLLSESEWGLMQCPLDVPLIQFGRQVRRPRRWFHTCSGEHAAILKAMRKMGMNRAGYTLPSSPWFPKYLETLPTPSLRQISEPTRPYYISYAVCCLKKNNHLYSFTKYILYTLYTTSPYSSSCYLSYSTTQLQHYISILLRST